MNSVCCMFWVVIYRNCRLISDLHTSGGVTNLIHMLKVELLQMNSAWGCLADFGYRSSGWKAMTGKTALSHVHVYTCADVAAGSSLPLICSVSKGLLSTDLASSDCFLLHDKPPSCSLIPNYKCQIAFCSKTELTEPCSLMIKLW